MPPATPTSIHMEYDFGVKNAAVGTVKTNATIPNGLRHAIYRVVRTSRYAAVRGPPPSFPRLSPTAGPPPPRTLATGAMEPPWPPVPWPHTGRGEGGGGRACRHSPELVRPAVDAERRAEATPACLASAPASSAPKMGRVDRSRRARADAVSHADVRPAARPERCGCAAARHGRRRRGGPRPSSRGVGRCARREGGEVTSRRLLKEELRRRRNLRSPTLAGARGGTRSATAGPQVSARSSGPRGGPPWGAGLLLVVREGRSGPGSAPPGRAATARPRRGPPPPPRTCARHRRYSSAMADGGGRKREAARVSTVDAGKAERERGGRERERDSGGRWGGGGVKKEKGHWHVGPGSW
ncbi:hypothetical protein PVAP13_9NG296573 [Panicum virgatum]|uniref:Uncharacterized protein n=1 Tax=Panicum virgatum TaxID=38727 RepID=A0A8T0MMU4_PANVG|nr:hypothetical protein PVAP13_9NG296573 [Panicum virgatum]